MLLIKGKKLLVLLLIMAMIFSFSGSAFADPVNAKAITISHSVLSSSIMLPYYEAPNYIRLKIDGENITSNPKYQDFSLQAYMGTSIINEDLELGVNLFIDENKGTITVKDLIVDIFYVIYSPYAEIVIGTETLNFVIKYDPEQPNSEIEYKDKNYYDDDSGYQVLFNDVNIKEWAAINSPIEFSGYIFGETRQYTLINDSYTWINIMTQTLIYKQ